MSHRATVLLSLILLVTSYSPAQTTRFVDAGATGPGTGSASSPFSSIQAAVNVAANGDTIQIAAGIYAENVNGLGRSLHYSGAGAFETIVQASNPSLPVMRLDFLGIMPTVVVEGLSVVGGQDGLVGAVTSATVRRVVARNSAGDGFRFTSGSLSMINCVALANSSRGLVAGPQATVRFCTLTANASTDLVLTGSNNFVDSSIIWRQSGFSISGSGTVSCSYYRTSTGVLIAPPLPMCPASIASATAPGFVSATDLRLNETAPAAQIIGLNLGGGASTDILGLTRGASAPPGAFSFGNMTGYQWGVLNSPPAAASGNTTDPNLMTVNGSFGGASRIVQVAAGQPWTLNLGQPSPNPGSAGFVIVGYVGIPNVSEVTQLPFGIGPLVFALPPAVPTFVLAHSFNPPDGLDPVPGFAPYSLGPIVVPFNFTLTFHAIILDNPFQFRPTNALVVRIGDG